MLYWITTTVYNTIILYSIQYVCQNSLASRQQLKCVAIFHNSWNTSYYMNRLRSMYLSKIHLILLFLLWAHFLYPTTIWNALKMVSQVGVKVYLSTQMVFWSTSIEKWTRFRFVCMNTQISADVNARDSKLSIKIFVYQMQLKFTSYFGHHVN